MQFYSGFSLSHEEKFFEPYIRKSSYTICGFSYGAIKALQATQKAVAHGERVDILQLFSPAFFQTKKRKFKRLQYISYRKNQSLYIKQFLSSCFAPYKKQTIEIKETTMDELQELLEYEWRVKDLEVLVKLGINIEVYFGGKDSIIDASMAKEFFVQVATVTFIKDANHFLLQ